MGALARLFVRRVAPPLRIIGQRLAGFAVTLVVVSAVTFGASRAAGNPLDAILPIQATNAQRAAIAHQFGLDHSLGGQYVRWLRELVQGNLGLSLSYGTPVSALLRARLPVTAALAGIAFAVSILIGVPLGVLAAAKRGRAIDDGVMFLTSICQAVPPFVTGLVLLWIFGVQLRIAPILGVGSVGSKVLPITTLVVFVLPSIVLVTRTSIIGTTTSHFVRFARARGVTGARLVTRHMLLHAALPLISYSGVMLARLVTGTIIVETIFAIPGFGRLAYDSAIARDFPVMQGIIVVSVVIIVLLTTIGDLAYGLVDPRVRRRSTI